MCNVRSYKNLIKNILEISLMKNLITILLMLISLQTMAQSVTGKVVDEKQNPVSFANIVVLSAKESARPDSECICKEWEYRSIGKRSS